MKKIIFVIFFSILNLHVLIAQSYNDTTKSDFAVLRWKENFTKAYIRYSDGKMEDFYKYKGVSAFDFDTVNLIHNRIIFSVIAYLDNKGYKILCPLAGGESLVFGKSNMRDQQNQNTFNYEYAMLTQKNYTSIFVQYSNDDKKIETHKINIINKNDSTYTANMFSCMNYLSNKGYEVVIVYDTEANNSFYRHYIFRKKIK